MVANRSPLFDLHEQLGARFTQFAGWEMPLQYQGIVAEHQAVRSQVGMFDVSHMAKWLIYPAGERALHQLVPSDLHRVKPQQAIYTLFLNEQGGIIDDVILYRLAAGWYVISNAGTYSKLKAWLASHLGDHLVDLTRERVLIALQGRRSLPILSELLEQNLSALPRFHHLTAEDMFIARTGYTGEDGLEIMLPPDQGRTLWQKLHQQGVTPCGLGCRDTLRLEAGLHLYGQDMDETTTPYGVGLGWTVHLDKGEFIGRSSLLSQTAPPEKLVGLRLTGKAIARSGYRVYHQGEVVGRVTSGTFSPTLNCSISFGYLKSAVAQIGQTVEVLVREQLHPATVTKRVFYTSQFP